MAVTLFLIVVVGLLFLFAGDLRAVRRDRRKSRLRRPSRPFSVPEAKAELYGPGAFQEGHVPVDTAVRTPPSRIARDIIERGSTLDRLPWLRSGCFPDPEWEDGGR